MIRFDLLGELRLADPDGAQVDQLLRQPKRLALLAYLVSPAPGTWHRRDILVGLFWPELDAAHARTALRNALYVIRQALGEGVILSRGSEEVAIAPERLQTDVAALKQALLAGEPGTALDLYRGEFLAGLFVADSEGFERWVDGERTRLKVELARAGLQSAERLEREGQLPEALARARRVLEIFPDDELAVRRLMGLHARVGDRVGALRLYEEFRQRLAQEFEAEPAPETQAMASRLRGPVGGVAPVSAPVDPDRGLPLPNPTPPELPRPGAVPTRSRLRNPVVVGVALALALALAWALRPMPRSPGLGQSQPLTADEGLQVHPAISPNGRLVAFAKGTPQHLRIHVQALVGGASWPLTGDSQAVEMMPRWSPDGDRIVYLARNSAWIAASVGGVPHLAAAGGPDEAAVQSASWSPHGDSLAIVRNDSLTVRPAAGTGFRFVGRGTQLHSCTWSPDGRWIACVSGNLVSLMPGPLFGNRAPSTLVIFPATGGEGWALTDGDREHLSPSWSADGRHLWMLSNRDGPSGEVYAIPIGRDGRAAGAVTRVGLQAGALSLAGDRVAYSVSSRTANVWSVPIPEGAPVTLPHATRLTSGNQIIEVLRTSVDRKWLVYDSNLRGNSDIYRLPLDGGVPERLTDDPREEFAGTLSPDGGELAYHRWTAGVRRVILKDLASGAVAEPIARAGDQGVPRWSPSGRELAIWDHSQEPGAIFVVSRGADGRWAAPSWTLVDAQLPAWSPDGGTIAFVTPLGTIELIGVDSSEHRTLYHPRAGSDDPIATNVEWDPDQPQIWFIGHWPSGGGGIWAVPLRGGPPRLLLDLRNPEGRSHGPTFASDGTRFYFTLEERISNIWWAALTAP